MNIKIPFAVMLQVFGATLVMIQQQAANCAAFVLAVRLTVVPVAPGQGAASVCIGFIRKELVAVQLVCWVVGALLLDHRHLYDLHY